MILSSEKGFSMIEVTISIFLISIIIVACMLFTGTSLKTSATNRMKNNAIRLAQQTIEDLKQYDQLGFDRNSDIWNDKSPKCVLTEDSVSIDNIQYTVKKRLIPNSTLNPNINDVNYIPIRITVEWNYNGTHQITVDTCLIRWQ